ncbi:hypothetical protein ABZS88_42170 [Streptomyces sp. NPDC005480]|uniref:hypothetical protein n=1 Tax=Streptomyces sp. NPDC005480 TaxID=3154880 RepID=UPI0033BC08E3
MNSEGICQQHHAVGRGIETDHQVPVVAFGSHDHRLAQPTARAEEKLAKWIQ